MQNSGNRRPAQDEFEPGDNSTADARKHDELPSKDTARERQNLVLTDPVAFRYLLDGPDTKVVERHAILEGFELYLVEQWACSRSHPTFIISTYTGQPQHRVHTGVLSVPEDEKDWSPRLTTYLKAVSTFHARRKDTELGTIMVTNLSSFPSALTVIQIPDGDFRKYREMFIVNENLKRLGCSGRAGLTLSDPTGATTTKFLQLFSTYPDIPVAVAVIELVKLCQVALVMYDKLAPEYADGLLCDVTERAVNEWWVKIGTDFFSIEPKDGILGPTTVSAILGLYVGARNRLNAYGAPVAKDAFDVRGMKRAIGYFQRANKLTGIQPRRLDLVTLQRLHRSTSKAAHNEGWAVPRAVKSTVAEYGGKGGEMVIGMVGREKTGIAEVETLDIKRFAEKVPGDYGRWLWQGKSKKAPSLDIFGAFAAADEEGVFSGDEKGNTLGPFKKRETGQELKPSTATTSDAVYINPLLGSQSSLETSDKDPRLRKTVLKNVTGRMSDARSGLGRFRNAVGISGLRGHHSRPSREIPESRTHISSDPIRPGSQSGPSKEIGRVGRLEPALSSVPAPRKPIQAVESEVPTTHKDRDSIEEKSLRKVPEQPLSSGSTAPLSTTDLDDRRSSEIARANFSQDPNYDTLRPKLERSQSLFTKEGEKDGTEPLRGVTALPRHASTGGFEAALTWMRTEGRKPHQDTDELTANGAMAEEQGVALKSQQALRELDRMSDRISSSVDAKLRDLEDLEARIRREYDSLSYAYAEKVREHRALQDGTSELLSEEDAFLTETFKELEILGAKLEYEMGSLVSKVEDVEDGVADFERQVEDLEERIDTLGKAEPKNERWRLGLFGW